MRICFKYLSLCGRVSDLDSCVDCRERDSGPYIKDDQVSVPCANHSEEAFCACVESAIAACKFENDLSMSRLNNIIN